LSLPEFHWLNGQWPGKIALVARPRGGDWVTDEIANWRRGGVHAIFSLLTREEEGELDLRDEASEARKLGLDFFSFPIADRQVPKSEAKLGEMLDKINNALSAGRNVLIHCRQGVGRSGLVAACLLIKNGMSPGAAVEAVSAARGVSVPETAEQREWIDRYSPAFTK
jgi:protein-tyrosine phosphatase